MSGFAFHIVSEQGARGENQDCAGSTSAGDLRCWVLADGLGGHYGGATAARIAIDAALDCFERSPACSPDAVRSYLEIADAALCDGQRSARRLREMRSTAVLLVAGEGQAVWGHVGDSRLYYFRSGRIAERTADHSVPQALVDRGEIRPEEVPFHEDRGRLLRSLGAGSAFRPTVVDSARVVSSADGFLLCTDGFWEQVPEDRMEDELRGSASPREWLEIMMSGAAAAAGDNYSAIAIFCRAA